MTNVSNKTINFIGAPEKRVRHRLGLGSLDMIKINELLEIAKNLGYSTEFVDCRNSMLKSDKYYTVFTGFSKLAIHVLDYDIAFDTDGYVTGIFEDRGEYPDYGIGTLVDWIFRPEKMKALVLRCSNEQPEYFVEFPSNREAKIRRLLGLADRRQFHRDQVLKLANFHGYKELDCESNGPNQFKVYPEDFHERRRKHHFQMTVGENDMIQSIVELNTV